MPNCYSNWRGKKPEPSIVEVLTGMEPQKLEMELFIIYQFVRAKFAWIPAAIREWEDPVDLAHDAIGAIMCGIRKWDHEKLSLSEMVNGVVSSWADALYKQQRRIDAKNMLKPPQADLQKPSSITCIADLPDTTQNKHRHENIQQKNETLFSIIFELIQHDKVLTAYLPIKIKHPQKTAQEIAAELGVKRKDIYNANKRLKTIIDKYKNQKSTLPQLVENERS